MKHYKVLCSAFRTIAPSGKVLGAVKGVLAVANELDSKYLDSQIKAGVFKQLKAFDKSDADELKKQESERAALRIPPKPIAEKLAEAAKKG